MKKKLLVVLALSLFVVFTLSVALYFAAAGWSWIESDYSEKLRVYESDLNYLVTVATRLGYTSANYIYSYRTYASTYDIAAVVFYSEDTLEQFTEKVSQLGFAQDYYYPEEADDRGYFLFFDEDILYYMQKAIYLIKHHSGNRNYLSSSLCSRWHSVRRNRICIRSNAP